MKRPWTFLLTAVFLLAPLPAADETRSLLRKPGPGSSVILEQAAAKALQAPLVTITDKAKPSPTGDAHDYVSYARYWWPDPAKPDGLPFIRKDGQHNLEQVDAGDRKKIDHLVDNVTLLALGWSRLHREECARRAGEWLRAWFVTPTTRMNPTLDYAQVRLGHNRNLGNAPGVIDTRTFAELVEVLPLLHGSPALTAGEETVVRQWFTDYFHWLETGPSAVEELAAKNNHGSWFLVQAVAIARYLGRDDVAVRAHPWQSPARGCANRIGHASAGSLRRMAASRLNWSGRTACITVTSTSRPSCNWRGWPAPLALTSGITPHRTGAASRPAWPTSVPTTRPRRTGRTSSMRN